MRFLCPACACPDGIEILSGIEVGADGRSDEIRLQVLSCRDCGVRMAGVYEESRRGALDAEAWRHAAHPLPTEALEVIEAAIAACPDPDDDACPCAGHQVLVTHDERGTWDALERLRRSAGGAAAPLRPARRAPLEAAVRWTATGDVAVPYRAVVDGEAWSLRLCDFPAEPLYALVVAGEPLLALSDWPAAWVRETR